MVHADVGVTIVVGQLLDDQFENIQFGLRAGQGGFLFQNLLRRLHPRHVRVTEDRQPVRPQFDDLFQCFIEGFDGLIGKSVDQVQVDGWKTGRARPLDDLLGLLARLNAMHRRLHRRIEILHANRGPIESHLAQSGDVVVRQPPRINLHARLHVRREVEMLADGLAEPTNFVGREERRRAAAPMQLHHLALRIDAAAHLLHFLVQVFEVERAFFPLRRDDGRAAAIPAKRFAEGDVEVKGKPARRLGRVANSRRHFRPGNLVGELRGRRIRGVTRPRHVVLLHQIKIDVEFAHLKFCTVLTSASRFSILASGGTPWPRLKM